MNKLLRFIAFAIVVVAPITVEATPVTWSFFETAITFCNGRPGIDCVSPPQPFVLMTLTLPGPTSAGTATYSGFPAPPVYTGDSFILSGLPFRPISPGFSGEDCSFGLRSQVCLFDISWSETAGVLTSVGINVLAVNDAIGTFAGVGVPFGGSFGLSGGPLPPTEPWAAVPTPNARLAGSGRAISRFLSRCPQFC